jgi:uncharacterized membrane protein
MGYLILKYLHVLGAIVILGTGTGIAFFMLMAHLSRDAAFIARTAGVVVLADLIFTTTAIIVQPVTGYLLTAELGLELTERWLLLSLALYVIAGAFWVPVVFIQARMHRLAKNAVTAGEPLPGHYHTLFRIWFVFGFPGFGAVLAILWLMIAKPGI